METIVYINRWIFENIRRVRYTVIMKTNVKFALIWTVFVIGSFLNDFFWIPRTYFSEKGNVFNVVFVKKGWGWTSLLLLSYITLTLIKQNIRIPQTYLKHIGRISIYTSVWYLSINLFLTIENWSGSCLGESSIGEMSTCTRRGFIWDGFDISGHCFLLTFCILNINKEIHDTMNLQIAEDNEMYQNGGVSQENLASKYDFNLNGMFVPGIYIDKAYNIIIFSLILLMVLWEMMLFFTCLYFHSLLQKLLGMLIGLFAYYLCHKLFEYQFDYLPTKVGLVSHCKIN